MDRDQSFVKVTLHGVRYTARIVGEVIRDGKKHYKVMLPYCAWHTVPAADTTPLTVV